MELINNTIHPALDFEGIDQHDQEFHVVVMRQTYTWNKKGLLVLSTEQDSLCMEDVLVDPTNLMSGVVEESDLCHYKPNCDVLIRGHAYTPPSRVDKTDFKASIHVQTPDKVIFEQAIKASKYTFANKSNKTNNIIHKYIKGNTLINKTLNILSPRYAYPESETLLGDLYYQIKIKDFTHKVSLNPKNSFGGYCIIEEGNPNLTNINPEALITKEERANIKLNPNHGIIAYFTQDNFNPSGSGSLTPLYYQAIKPKKVQLPQIHYIDHSVNENIINKMIKKDLNQTTHNKLVAGFGVRSKSHPDRHKYMGDVGQEFIDSGRLVPKDFDFAIWNSAYPDQQTEKMIGNEWITLTNLCRPDTVGATQTNKGTELKLYLSETVAYLVTKSNDTDKPEAELPMKLDTIIIHPDEQKVNLVWRGIIAGHYNPQSTLLETADRAKQQQTIQQYFTQKGDIIRPYEQEIGNEQSLRR